MKKIIVIILGLTISLSVFPSYGGVNLDKVADALSEYVKLHKKKKYEEASEQLSYAKRVALDINTTDLSKQHKAIVAYLYLLDLRRQGKKGSTLFDAGSAVVVRGQEPGRGIADYSLGFATADARFQMGKGAKTEYKGIYYLQAYTMLLMLEQMDAKYSPAWKDVFDAAGFEVSASATKKLLAEVLDTIGNISGETWFRNACTAVDNKDIKMREALGKMCINFAKKYSYPDAEALEGFVYEHGKLGEKNEHMADSLYAVAAANGSVWGSMQHAKRLYMTGKYNETLSILEKYSSHPKFSNEGGNYLMGLLIEQKVVKNAGPKDALKYYTANNEKCRWNLWKKDAQRRIQAIEKAAIDADVKNMVAANGPVSKWKGRELAAVAESYERLGEKESGEKYRFLAAEKGHPRSVNICAVKMYDKARKKVGENDEELLKKMAHLLLVNEKGMYLPTLYNLVIVYTYGYGVTPDHDKAKKYFEQYLSYVEDENPGDYDKDEFLGTISGIAYNHESTFKGAPLKTMLENFDKPGALFNWARYREHDSRPEVWQYFYRRAASLGSEKAASRLRQLNLSL